jgi:hypothetical protein
MNEPCERCGKNEVEPGLCEGDGQRHPDGKVHVLSHREAQALCPSCAREAMLEWSASRRGKAPYWAREF